MKPLIRLQLIFVLLLIAAAIPWWLVLAQQTELKSVDQIVKSGNGQTLAVTYNSGTSRSIIDLFDNSTGELTQTVDVSPSLPNTIALNPTGNRIAHVGLDGELGIFNISTGIDTSIATGSPDAIQEVEWNPINDKLAYVVGNRINVLDALSETIIQIVMTGGPLVGEIAWSPNGRYLATSHYAENPLDTGSPFRAIKIWDTTSTENPLITPSNTIENRGGGRVSWDPNGVRLAILESRRLLVYNVTNQQMVVDLAIDEEFLHMVAWNQSGDLLATGGDSLRIWNTTTWQITKTITLDEPVSSFQWSLDGQHLFNDGGVDGLYRDDIPVSQLPVTPTFTLSPHFY